MSKRMGCLYLFVMLLVLTVFAMVLVGDPPEQGRGVGERRDVGERRNCTPTRYDAATTMVDSALDQGVIRLDAQNLEVIVSPAFWDSMDFQGKRGMAKAIDCAVAGVGKSLRSFRIRDMQSGRTLATWSLGDLEVE